MNDKNFLNLMQSYAEKNPNHAMITIDENTLTYKQLIDETNIISKGLKQLNLKTNQKIGLIMPNCIDWYKIFWSAIRIGAQPVPIDPQSGVLELKRLIDTIQFEVCFIAVSYRSNNILSIMKSLINEYKCLKKIIVINNNSSNITLDEPFVSIEQFYKLCNEYSKEVEIFQPNDSHVMSLACTSGSTGNPKILTVPYIGFYDAIVDMGKYLEFNSNDVMMLGMTLYHQGGFGMGLQTIVNGGEVLYQPKFDPIKFLKTVEKHRVTIIQLTSTLAKILISVPNFNDYDLSSVKVCYFAGEVLPFELAQIFVEKLHIRVINVIGSSETATMVVWDSSKDYGIDPNTFQTLPFTKVRILNSNGEDVQYGEIGELCIYTTAVIFNYYKNPVDTIDKVKYYDGERWFKTGDLVERLENNQVRFVGRSKRIIKKGGNLVYAEEVEASLLTHPKITAVAVVDENHQIFGQMITAYIQLIDNETISRGEIAKYFKGKLSSYKLPDKIVVIKEIPKDVGKIQFKYLRKN